MFGVSIHLADDAKITVEYGRYPTSPTSAGRCYLMLATVNPDRPGTGSLNIHNLTPQAMIVLGEQIAAAGHKLDDEQKQAAIRADLAKPLPDPFLPAKESELIAETLAELGPAPLWREWTADEILRQEG